MVFPHILFLEFNYYLCMCAFENTFWFIGFYFAIGTTSIVAGSGRPGFKDGDASTTQFNTPCGLAIDTERNIFVADFGNHRVRKISGSGVYYSNLCFFFCVNFRFILIKLPICRCGVYCCWQWHWWFQRWVLEDSII